MNYTIPSLMTELEAAKYLNISHRTLQKLRCTGHGPKFIKINKTVRYRLSDLDAFIATGERLNTTSEAA